MKQLLIVVDMINAFAHAKGTLARSNITGEFYGVSIIQSVAGLVSMYRDKNLPIIWLFDAHAEDDLEFKRFPKHAVKNTWESEIVAQLAPKLAENSPNELMIPKTRYSGFYGTDLEYQLARLSGLRGQPAPEVEVCGVCTSICVMDTVGGLANRDYETVVRKECVADFDPEAHEGALLRMGGLYGAQVI